MGRVDAAHVRGRCPGVSPLPWATAPRGVRSEGAVRTRLIAVDNRRAEMNHLQRGAKGFQLRSERSLDLNGNDNGSSLTEEVSKARRDGFRSAYRPFA
jgi:hypothetical protein